MPLYVPANLPVVVYLDDEAENRQAFEYALLDHAKVEACADLRTAFLALSRLGSVDVVVADLVMPGTNGIEFLTKAAEFCPIATRVAITALDQVWPVVEAMNRAVVHRLYDRVEAFGPGKLEQIIAEAVEASIARAFEQRLAAVMPELLGRMAEAGQEWRVDLILARASRALQIMRLLLPYLDLPVQARVDLLFSGLFCNLSNEMFGGTSEWNGVQEALADCLEMWDGSGPHQKVGDQIPIPAQILGVVIGFYNWMMAMRKESGGVVEEAIERTIARLESAAGTRYSRDALAVFLKMARDKRAELVQLFSA